MPRRERVEEFVRMVMTGDHVGAIRDFYHDDASMQEPDKEPRQGLAFLMEHEAGALAKIARMDTHAPLAIVVEGNAVVIHWIFDAVAHDGTVRRLEELAIQTWRGDRIARERFFYDTASAWRRICSDIRSRAARNLMDLALPTRLRAL